MPVLSLACHLPHNTPHIPSRYNNEQTTKQTKAIDNSYIYINISCKCDTNRAGHFTLDAYASRPVACHELWPKSVSHPFSSLNSSLGVTGWKYYRKVTIPIFRLILQNFGFPGCLSCIFFIAIFSPYLLLVGLLLQYVTVSVQGTS